MLLLSIGGQRLSKDCPPNELLVNQAGQEVQLVVAESDGSSPRTVCVEAARSESSIRYRDWVEHNRQYVHERTDGRVGYVHVPDMGADGFAEFHRHFLAEFDHEGLIVDVRFNRGGSVSGLLLQKLARRRLGYDVSRWMGAMPYPRESARGPMVAVTNEYAASDGDIFSHAFKLMKLGALIGRRTWGGVIGIMPRNWLVDGTETTQPEFSRWFVDVGWGVENYGTDPDIEVDITPQDYARGVDTQLDRAIEVILEEVEQNPPSEPSMDARPRLTLPG
jgi:tricorn protease